MTLAVNDNRTRAADLRYRRRGLYVFLVVYLGALVASMWVAVQ